MKMSKLIKVLLIIGGVHLLSFMAAEANQKHCPLGMFWNSADRTCEPDIREEPTNGGNNLNRENNLPMVKVGVAELKNPTDSEITTYFSSISNGCHTYNVPSLTESSANIGKCLKAIPVDYIFSSEASELARALDYDALTIFNYIRNNIGITPIFGLQKGIRGVILDEHGTSFDQAHALVELLRISDKQNQTRYNPRFKFGTLTLTGAQFTNWYGVSNAYAAKRILADGGIPATVSHNGEAISSVTLSHIWVEATIKGSLKRLDPSYKKHRVLSKKFKSINDAQGVAGFKSALLSTGVNPASTSSKVISGFHVKSFKNLLSYYRSNVETHLQNKNPGEKTDIVLGGLVLKPFTTDDKLTDSNYSGSQNNWSVIPDGFRTTYTVSLQGAGSWGTYYADEQYGRQQVFFYAYNSSAQKFLRRGRSEYSYFGFGGTCERALLPTRSNRSAAIMTVHINHPYPARNNVAGAIKGSYMDRTLVKQLAKVQCSGQFYITNDWGRIGTGTTKRFSRVGWKLAEFYNYLEESMLIMGSLKNVALQYSQFLHLTDKILETRSQLHDLIGVHQVSKVATETNIGRGSKVTDDVQRMVLFDFEAGISINSLNHTGAQKRRAASYVATSGLSMVESAVVRQEADSTRDVTPLTLMTHQDTQANNPGTYNHYLVNSSNWREVINNNGLSGYDSAALLMLQSYVREGYSLFLPERGKIGEKTFTTYYPKGDVFDKDVPVETTLREGHTYGGGDPEESEARFYRSVFYAFKENDMSAGALLMFDPWRNRALKGGVNIAITDERGKAISPATPKAHKVESAFSALQVNGNSGSFSYSPPADLSIGTGGFPRQLTFQRRYNSHDHMDYGLGRGWRHNWYHTVSMLNDGMMALGDSHALGAASAMVAIESLAAIMDNSALEARHHLAALHVQAWFTDQSLNNAASVTAGLGGSTKFIRLAYGAYAAATPTGATLVQKNTVGDSLLNRRIYNKIEFIYTGASGDVRKYSHPEAAAAEIARNHTSPAKVAQFAKNTFYMSEWKFPSGGVINTDFVKIDGVTHNIAFRRVGNNFGFSISGIVGIGRYGEVSTICEDKLKDRSSVNFNNSDGSATYRTFVNGEMQKDRVTFTWPNRMKVTHFNCDDSVDEEGYPQGPTISTTVTSPTPLISVMYATGKSTFYQYTDVPQTEMTGYFTKIPQLSKIYMKAEQLWPPFFSRPSNPSRDAKPDLVINYGKDLNVHNIQTARLKTYKYYSSPFRSSTKDPLGQSTVSYYDYYGRAIRSVSDLGFEMHYAYDDLDRLIKTIYPEGDELHKSYDQWHNIIEQVAKAKAGSNLSDMNSNAAYKKLNYTYPLSGETVTIMVQDYVVDAKGNRTDLTYHANGLLYKVKKPLVNGMRPIFTMNYNNKGQLTNSINAENMVTERAYDTYGNLRAITVDSLGKKLKSVFFYDKSGKLCRTVDPRGSAALTGGYDAACNQ